MKRFNRILVVCQDDSQCELAIERARNLARANDAAVTLMDVVDIDHRELASVFSNMSDRM
ncbi:MAG: universal stress protein, partial [Aestuariivirgaceae bacterium]